MATGLPGEPAMRPMRFRHVLALLVLLASVLLATSCASSGKGDALQRAQYAWSAAIRWGDFEGAWNLVDPAYRAEHPMNDLAFERYRQVQVSHYREGGEQSSGDLLLRDVEIGVVNRHTMAERSLRYREAWRWDPEARTWWITGGLPDFWHGE